MKMKALMDDVATACDMRAKAVTSVHDETFRLLRAALEKGERVTIPGFGVFYVKEVEAKEDKPARKVVRFKMKDSPEAGGKNPGRDRKAKKPAQRSGKKKAAKLEKANGAVEQAQQEVSAAVPVAEKPGA